MLKSRSVFIKLLLGSMLVIILMLAFGCNQEVMQGDFIDDFIILATTTSTDDSGLLDFINPLFTQKTGLEVQVVSQGTGAALEIGARGDADVLLVHDRVAELELVESGNFIERYDVMYNDFIMVGPEDDPAGLMNVGSVIDAYSLIAEGGHTFVSRGDDSGTHRMELRLWDSAVINPARQSWYLSVGQGMGDTLNIANEELGYSMTDRGTYVAMKDNLDLVVVLEDDPVLFNQYGVMSVNPEQHNHVKYDYARMYTEFLMSDEGQDLISSFQVNGESLFFQGYGLE